MAHEAADRHTPQNAALIPQGTTPLLRGCFRNTLSCKQRGCGGAPISQLFALRKQKKTKYFIIGHRKGEGEATIQPDVPSTGMTEAKCDRL